MVDPHNLGDPVYKEDQVITIKDLEDLEQLYRQYEAEFLESGDSQFALECCIGHQITEGLRLWVEAGKPVRRPHGED